MHFITKEHGTEKVTRNRRRLGVYSVKNKNKVHNVDEIKYKNKIARFKEHIRIKKQVRNKLMNSRYRPNRRINYNTSRNRRMHIYSHALAKKSISVTNNDLSTKRTNILNRLIKGKGKGKGARNKVASGKRKRARRIHIQKHRSGHHTQLNRKRRMRTVYSYMSFAERAAFRNSLSFRRNIVRLMLSKVRKHIRGISFRPKPFGFLGLSSIRYKLQLADIYRRIQFVRWQLGIIHIRSDKQVRALLMEAKMLQLLYTRLSKRKRKNRFISCRVRFFSNFGLGKRVFSQRRLRRYIHRHRNRHRHYYRRGRRSKKKKYYVYGARTRIDVTATKSAVANVHSKSKNSRDTLHSVSVSSSNAQPRIILRKKLVSRSKRQVQDLVAPFTELSPLRFPIDMVELSRRRRIAPRPRYSHNSASAPRHKRARIHKRMRRTDSHSRRKGARNSLGFTRAQTNRITSDTMSYNLYERCIIGINKLVFPSLRRFKYKLRSKLSKIATQKVSLLQSYHTYRGNTYSWNIRVRKRMFRRHVRKYIHARDRLRSSVEHAIHLCPVRELRRKNKYFFGSSSSFLYRLRTASGSILKKRPRARYYRILKPYTARHGNMSNSIVRKHNAAITRLSRGKIRRGSTATYINMNRKCSAKRQLVHRYNGAGRSLSPNIPRRTYKYNAIRNASRINNIVRSTRASKYLCTRISRERLPASSSCIRNNRLTDKSFSYSRTRHSHAYNRTQSVFKRIHMNNGNVHIRRRVTPCRQRSMRAKRLPFRPRMSTSTHLSTGNAAQRPRRRRALHRRHYIGAGLRSPRVIQAHSNPVYNFNAYKMAHAVTVNRNVRGTKCKLLQNAHRHMLTKYGRSELVRTRDSDSISFNSIHIIRSRYIGLDVDEPLKTRTFSMHRDAIRHAQSILTPTIHRAYASGTLFYIAYQLARAVTPSECYTYLYIATDASAKAFRRIKERDTSGVFSHFIDINKQLEQALNGDILYANSTKEMLREYYKTVSTHLYVLNYNKLLYTPITLGTRIIPTNFKTLIYKVPLLLRYGSTRMEDKLLARAVYDYFERLTYRATYHVKNSYDSSNVLVHSQLDMLYKHSILTELLDASMRTRLLALTSKSVSTFRSICNVNLHLGMSYIAAHLRTVPHELIRKRTISPIAIIRFKRMYHTMFLLSRMRNPVLYRAYKQNSNNRNCILARLRLRFMLSIDKYVLAKQQIMPSIKQSATACLPQVERALLRYHAYRRLFRMRKLKRIRLYYTRSRRRSQYKWYNV